MTALPPDLSADLRQENARLHAELRAARERQNASAEILRAIAGSSGDAEKSLQQIAVTTERLFRASSVTLLVANGERFGLTVRVGAGSERIAAAIPLAHIAITPQFMPGAVYLENRQVHVGDVDDPTAKARWPGLAPARTVGTRTMSGTPLRYEGRAIGSLIVHRDRLEPFTTDELALQQSFADQAAIAIENARLFNESQQALARQTATSEILRVISGSPTDVQPVFDAIVLTAARLFRCDRAFIQRCDGTGFWTVASAGPQGPLPITQFKKAPIDPDANFPSRAIVAKKTLHLPDWSLIELPEFERHIRETHGTNSALYMPLLREGECIGLLAIIGKQAGMFGESEIALAESFRDQALIAIENTRLFNETKEALERQTVTADILKVIASSPSDTTPVFEAIATSANRLLGGFSAAVFRFLDGTVHLAAFTPVSRAADAALKADFPKPVDEFEGFRLAEQGKPFPIADTEEIPHPPELREIARLHGFRSMLFVPLMNGGVPIGIISVTRREPGAFSPNHIQLLQTFADQAVIAVVNARLFNETREALERQTATAEILKVIAGSPDDVQPVFEAIVCSAAKLFEPCSATITTLKDDKLHWNATAASISGFDVDRTRAVYPIPFDRDRAPSARAIHERRIIEIPDVASPDTPEFTRNAAAAGGFRSITFVPLVDQEQGIGTIIFTHPQAGFRFSERQLALIQAFADQAVIAIQNARLFNETQEALERQTATADILKVIASSPSDVQPVFEAIAASANRLIGGFSTAVHRVIDDVVQLVAFTPTNPESDEALKAAFPVRRNEMAAVAMVQNGETAQVADAETADPQTRRLGRARGWRSVTFTPLMSQGGFIGFIACTRRETGVLGDHHVQLLQTFADQAVIAIENARLFNETREALERQTATSDILKVIASSPNDVQPVFDVIVERAVRLCGARMGRVYRYDDGIIHMVAGHGLSTPGLSKVQEVFPRPAADDTTAGLAIRSRQPYFVTDIESDQSAPPLSRQMIEALGTRSQVTVPMLRSGEPIGAITVGWAEPAAYGKQQVALLETFADQAVIAIENVRLFNETREALERQTATADILKVIASSPSDVQPVFEAIASSANRLIGGFSSTVFRFIDGVAHLKAFTSTTPAADEVLRATFPRPVADFPAFQMAQAGEVTQIPDTEALSDEILDIARARGYRGMLFTPLMNDGVSIGFIAVTRVQPGAFADHHVQLLRTFADQAVIAIENVRLFDEVQAKTRDLTEALTYQTGSSNILKVIASSPTDVGPVLKAIVESACELCDAHDAVVRLRDGDDLLFSAHHGPIPMSLDKWPINRNWITGRAVMDKMPIHVHDLLSAEGDEFPEAQEIARRQGHRTILSVPLLRDNESIGAIVLRRTEVAPFGEKQIALLQTFADQAVIALDNVRLFDEVQARTDDLRESLQQQTATADVLKVISRSVFDLQTVLDTLVESAYKLCGAKLGLLYLQGDEAYECKAIAGTGVAEANLLFKGRPIRAGRGTAAERVILTGEVQSVTDFFEDPDFDPKVRETIRNAGDSDSSVGQLRSTLAVPMTRDDAVIGVLVIGRSQTGPFPPRQIELLQTFADQAVIAIENARLFDEVQAKTRDLTEALTYQTGSSNILRVIASSPTDVEPVLKAIVESACELCAADDALVQLRDGDDLVYAAHRGSIPVGLQRRTINPNFIGGRAVIDRVPVHLRDVLSAEGDEFPESQEISRPLGTRTLLCVPLLGEGESIGTILLRRTEVNPFSDKQISLLQTFADQAVIAIGNVRLFDEVQKKTSDLSEALQQQTATADVLKAISRSAFDLQPVLDVIVETSRELCGCDASTIFLLRDRKFHVTAVSGTLPAHLEFLRSNPASVDQPGSVLARVYREKRTLHYPNVADDPELSQGMTGLGGPRALLTVPLMRDDEVIGGITLRQSHLKPFTDRQIEAIETFADQAVIAISNVGLFEQVQERTRELSQSLDELRTAQDRLVQTEKLASLGQLTAGIAHEIKNPLNFVNNFSALSAELTDELNDLLRSADLTDKLREEIDELTAMLKDNLQKVVQHGKRADSIVKNMLLHSREGSGEHRPADINAILDESLNLAYHGARAEKREFNVTLQRDFDEMAGTIEVFPQEITRVFLNLISNGFYAVTKRKSENGSSDFEPVVRATTRSLGDAVEIRIRDNGTGIPAEVREKMFNPFFTTKPAGEGTGLGLSMSHDIIVKQHGGRIDVETEPGQFTEFRIVLPRTKNLSDKNRGQT
jgi:GAF domain-containing protein